MSASLIATLLASLIGCGESPDGAGEPKTRQAPTSEDRRDDGRIVEGVPFRLCDRARVNIGVIGATSGRRLILRPRCAAEDGPSLVEPELEAEIPGRPGGAPHFLVEADATISAPASSPGQQIIRLSAGQTICPPVRARTGPGEQVPWRAYRAEESWAHAMRFMVNEDCSLLVASLADMAVVTGPAGQFGGSLYNIHFSADRGAVGSGRPSEGGTRPATAADRPDRADDGSRLRTLPCPDDRTPLHLDAALIDRTLIARVECAGDDRIDTHELVLPAEVGEARTGDRRFLLDLSSPQWAGLQRMELVPDGGNAYDLVLNTGERRCSPLRLTPTRDPPLPRRFLDRYRWLSALGYHATPDCSIILVQAGSKVLVIDRETPTGTLYGIRIATIEAHD